MAKVKTKIENKNDDQAKAKVLKKSSYSKKKESKKKYFERYSLCSVNF